MKPEKLATDRLLIISMVILSGCKDLQITNSFDSACLNEVINSEGFAQSVTLTI